MALIGVIADDPEMGGEPAPRAGIALVLAPRRTSSAKRFSCAKKPFSCATYSGRLLRLRVMVATVTFSFSWARTVLDVPAAAKGRSRIDRNKNSRFIWFSLRSCLWL